MAPNSFAWKQNLEISSDGKLRHAAGFARPYLSALRRDAGGNACPYKNWDFHDQDTSDREPPTLLFPATTNDGHRFLLLGTKTRILRQDEAAGTWAQVSTGTLGVDGDDSLTQTRFKAAQLQNKVAFTNGLDDVQGLDLTDNSFGPLTGLATASETGGAVTAANVIIEYKGVVLLMNVVEDGVRIRSRIRWCDLNNLDDWGADAASISDFQDLDYDEEILGAVTHANVLYIYTAQSIWRANFTVDVTDPALPTATLVCVQIYNEPKNQDKCLAYPNTLISTGFEMFYMGRDGIYEFDPYKVQPELKEWIFRSDPVIFDSDVTGIDTTACNSPIAEYHPDTKEIHFSWPSPDAIQIASSDCTAPAPIKGAGINRHTLVVNLAFTTCDYRDYGMTAMVNFKSDIGESGSCNQKILFLGALGSDFALKELNVGFAREVYDVESDSYSLAGYVPRFVGVFPFGAFTQDKEIKSFRIDALPDGNTGSVFRLRTGTSFQIVNPNKNTGNCGVVWRQWSNRAIKCPDKYTPAQYAALNIRPANDFFWSFLARGRYLYYEVSITKPDGTPAVSGGVSMSRLDVEAIQI